MEDAGPTIVVQVTLPVLDSDGARLDVTGVGVDLRRLWIVEQVRQHHIGIARGAVLARLSRAELMALLGGHGVPVIDHPAGDLARELSILGAG